MAAVHRSARPITRRRLLGGGLGVLALGALAACGAGGGGSDRVRFAIYGSPAKLEVRRNAIERFSELHPDRPVAFEGIPSDEWEDKIATQVAGGNAPDVFALSVNSVPEYAGRNALAPLDEFVSRIFHADSYEPSVLELGKFDGKIYSAPIAIGISGIGYNRAALQRLGIDPPDGSWTFDDYARVCAQVHEASGGELHGTQDPVDSLRPFHNFMRAQGRTLFNGASLAVTVDDVGRWLDYWQRMRVSGACVPADLTAQFTGSSWQNSPIVRRKAVFGFMQSNDISGGYQALIDDELDMTGPPRAVAGGSPGVAPSPTSSLCLYSRSRNKEAAVQVLDWFVNSPESAAILGMISGPPASKPAREAATALPDLSPIDKKVLAYTEAALAAAVSPEQAPKGYSEVQDLLRRVSEDVGFGRTSVQDGAATFVNDAQAILAKAA